MIQRCRSRNRYVLSTLPSVPYYRQSSSAAEEEEVLLLPELSSPRNKEICTDWENEENDNHKEDSIDDSDSAHGRQPLSDDRIDIEL